jgi:predicted lipid-binding transport protein (Tim44 family)
MTRAAALLVSLLALDTAILQAASLDAPPQKAALGALDIIFIGMAVYILWRLFSNLTRRKSGEDDDKTYDATPMRDGEEDDPRDRRSRAAQAAWEYLTGEPGKEIHHETEHVPDSPGTFNEKEFLSGAKMIYGRIKQSLAMRNMADLRQFAAPDMMTQFEKLAAEKPDRETVAVMLVEAKVLDVRRDGKRTEVDVAYDATISDDPKTNASRQVSEVWKFSRDETAADAKWLLEEMEARQ